MGLHGILSSNYIKRALSVRPESLVSIWPQAEPSGAISREIVRQYLGAYTGVTLGQPGIGDGRVGLTCPYFDGANDFNNIYSAGLANDNLLLNPGFETAGGGGADIWANWVETVSDGALANEVVVVHQGVDACKMTAGPTADTRINQLYVAIPNTRYRIRLWTQGDGINDGIYHVWDATNGADIIGLTHTGVTGAAYGMVEAEFVAPVGCVSINVFLRCPNVNGGICYFDACEVRRTNGFLGDRGTIIVPARVANAGVWTDGLVRYLLAFTVAGTTRIALIKPVAANTIGVEYSADGTTENVNIAVTTLNFFWLGITWDISAGATGEVKAFYNGAQSGVTQIGLGTWLGNLLNTHTRIGSYGAGNYWHGYIAPVPIFSEVLTQPEIAYLSEPQ